MSNKMQLLPMLAVLVGVACSDAAGPSAPRSIEPVDATSADRFGRMQDKFVAIGTSVSMGWASNGVYAGSQLVSWPALIGFGTLQPLSLPLIQSPGCISPIVAPLGAGLRLSGESIAGSTTCAGNVDGVTLPTQNVGLAGALAADAVQSTPESKGASAPWYFRVLPLGTTQLTAGLGQHPTIVSVELGANEVLNGTSGLVAPGVTVVPFPFFAAPYDALLDALSAAHVKVVLAGLPKDGRNLASLRKATEIWADRAEFAALHVTVSTNCENSPNYINVSQLSLNLVFAAAQGAPNVTYSCADVPGTPDFVLTPDEMNQLNALLNQMGDHIRAQATARGFGFFSLGALYDRPDLKGGAYSIVAQLTSKFPYGYYTSLDGVHPSPLGHAVLAAAAAFGYNQTYFGHDVASRGASANLIASAPALSLGDQLEESELPAAALDQARRIAAANAGRKVSACIVPVAGMPGC